MYNALGVALTQYIIIYDMKKEHRYYPTVKLFD